jgi:hypothetical protein
MLVLAALVLSGSEAYRRGLPIVIALLVLVYGVESAIFWLRSRDRAQQRPAAFRPQTRSHRSRSSAQPPAVRPASTIET